MRIIINADDLGLTHESNMGIAECFERGFVTQTTLVANSPWAEEGAAIAHERGFADRVGLHFNLKECPPLTKAIAELPKYVRDGELWYDPAYMKKETYGMSPLLTYVESYLEEGFAAEVEAIRQEFAAHVERFRQLGFALDHVDSHNNAFVDLPTWLAVRPVVAEVGFRTMRCTFDSFGTDDLYNEVYRAWLVAERAKLGLKTTDFSGSVTRFGKRRAELPEDCLAEIYVHPIKVGGQLIDNFTGGLLIEDQVATLEGLERTSFFEL